MIWCTEFGNECEMPAAIDMFIRVSHLLVCFNSSANFVVYYLNGEKFRELFVVAVVIGISESCFGIWDKKKLLE